MKLKIDTEFHPRIKLAAMQAKILFDTFGWTWGESKTPPTVYEIEDHIADQVKRLLEGKQESGDYISSGRIMTMITGEEGYKEVSILFDLESIYSDEEGK